jgi:hypothetical protein
VASARTKQVDLGTKREAIRTAQATRSALAPAPEAIGGWRFQRGSGETATATRAHTRDAKACRSLRCDPGRARILRIGVAYLNEAFPGEFVQ